MRLKRAAVSAGPLLLLSLAAANACPRSCSCSERSGVVVQCTSRNLDNIPPDLPPDTAVLLLSSNRIRHVPRDAFAALRRLRELDLSHNALEGVEAGAFKGVADSLRALDLSDNRLSALPKDAFASVRARVRLSNNPWHCECSLQEVLRELQLSFKSFFFIFTSFFTIFFF